MPPFRHRSNKALTLFVCFQECFWLPIKSSSDSLMCEEINVSWKLLAPNLQPRKHNVILLLIKHHKQSHYLKLSISGFHFLFCLHPSLLTYALYQRRQIQSILTKLTKQLLLSTRTILSDRLVLSKRYATKEGNRLLWRRNIDPSSQIVLS